MNWAPDRAAGLDIPRAAPFERAVADTAPVAGAVVRGSIGGADVEPGPLFVGLFATPIAQGRPVAGMLLPAPGPFVLSGVPDGCYYLLAAALLWSSSPLGYLLPGERLRMGRSAGPLVVRQRRACGESDLALRLLQPTDPPLVVALPSLLCARIISAAGAACRLRATGPVHCLGVRASRTSWHAMCSSRNGLVCLIHERRPWPHCWERRRLAGAPRTSVNMNYPG